MKWKASHILEEIHSARGIFKALVCFLTSKFISHFQGWGGERKERTHTLLPHQALYNEERVLRTSLLVQQAYTDLLLGMLWVWFFF